MNKIYNNTTAVGKSGKTLLWVVVSVLLTGALTNLTHHPELFNPTVVAVANVVLVLLKNIFDKEVPNV